MTETTLTEAREAVADALTALEGLNVRARGPVKLPRTGDGWVTVGRLTPASYTACSVTVVAVIILGADTAAAEELLDLWAVDIIDAVTTAEDLPVSDVALEPITLVVESGATLHALTVTLTTEVET